MLISPWPDVDAVLEMSSSTIVATRGVSIGEDFFEHHFPGNPIVPAVMQLSWLEHAGGILVAHYSAGRCSAVLGAVLRLTCIRLATPGDCLELQLKLHAELTAAELTLERCIEATGLITRGGSRVLRTQLVFTVVPYRSTLRPWQELATELGIPAV